MEMRRLTVDFGYEVCNVDCRDLMDSQVRQIQTALDEDALLLFRGQNLTRDQHIEFARKFGELGTVFNKGYRELKKDKRPGGDDRAFDPNADYITTFDEFFAGDMWHSDIFTSSYACIYGEKMTGSGDLMWSNGFAAYDSLSPKMKSFFEDMWVINDSEKFHPLTIEHHVNHIFHPESAKKVRRFPMDAHPLIFVHPKTGRKAIRLNSHGASGIADMKQVECEPIIQFLKSYTTQHRFIYRHIWRDGDMFLWDLRGTQHKNVFVKMVPRLLHRIPIDPLIRPADQDAINASKQTLPDYSNV